MTEFHGLFQQEVAGEPFDVGFILAVGVCLEGQVQVFVGQVEAVLQRQHATHVDTLAFAVDIGASEGQAAYGEGADFVVADLAYQPRTPAAPLFLQPVLRGRQRFAGRDRVVPATETGAGVGVQQDGVVALAGAGLFDGLLPGQFVRAGLIGMIGDGAAGQDQVAGPRGDLA
ncbi:hypothetical protein D9M73_179740 [compost metagenome]